MGIKVSFTKRQTEIINVSIDIIAERGIQNLTIKNISKSIGISEPAIYRHFDTKMDILLAILSYFKQTNSIVLEMPEHMIPQMGMFAECQRNGIYLRGEFTAADKKVEVEADGNGWKFDDLELEEFETDDQTR